MSITLTIVAEDENDYRRQICRLATPYLEGFVAEGGFDPEPVEVEPSPPPSAQTAAAPEPEPKKGGRPRGSANKPKTNGAEAQTEPREQNAPGEGLNKPQPNGAGEPLSLAEQIQIITDAAHDAPDKFKPLLVPLREALGVQYISKALEKDRAVLQGFINEHGLAV